MTRNKFQNYCFFVALVAISLFSISLCTDENEFYIGGSFLEVFQDADGNIKHAASLIAYSFETELLDDDFDGVFLDDNNISNFVATETGIYASGPFSFVDYDYSNTITEYDADDDEWTSLNEGIWCSDCVRFIAGVGTTVFFAGDSDQLVTLETLPGVNVDGIVMMDADSEDFSPLSDPTDVFPANPQIESIAGSPLGDYLYIFETNTNTIYQYDVANGGFVAAFSNFTMTVQNDTLTVAPNGDIYTFAYSYDGENITQSILYWPANFTAGMKPKEIAIKHLALTEAICQKWPSMIPYKEGVLVSIPDPSSDPVCLSSFTYVSGGVKSSADIPPSNGPVAMMTSGINDEVWAAFDINNYNILYYYNSTLTDWVLISLSDENIDTYNINFLTYYNDKSSAYVVLFDYDDGMSTEVVRVKSDNLDVVLKSPGSLSSPGYVNGLAYDADNEALFVGGYFSGVGGGAGAQNLAYYSFKDKDWQGMKTGRVEGLANIDSTVYLIYTACGSVNDQIPFAAYSIDEGDVDVSDNLPIFYEDQGCLFSISTNSTHVYVGGQFVAQLNLDFAYGFLTYDVEEGTWSTLPINSSIADSDSFAILTIEEFSIGDALFVAFGGTFAFTANDQNGSPITFNDIALYNITSQNWVAISNPGMITVNSIVYMYESTIIIGGSALPGANAATVKSYNISTSTYASVSGLLTPVETILLYTQSDKDDNPEWTSIYAGGHSPTGVVVSNFTDPDWLPVGAVYDNMYTGSVKVLQYSTGGQGSNGVNGDNSNNGGSDWWWITLTVIGSIILLVVVVVVIGGVGYFIYQRRAKSKYDAL